MARKTFSQLYWGWSEEKRQAHRDKCRQYRIDHPTPKKPRLARVNNNISFRSDVKNYIDSIKIGIGECADCAFPCEDWNVMMFAFDHLDPTLKSFALSKAYQITGMTKEQIDAEIAKCELVCHNCHAFRTWIERQHDQNEPCDNDEREYLPLLELMR